MLITLSSLFLWCLSLFIPHLPMNLNVATLSYLFMVLMIASFTPATTPTFTAFSLSIDSLSAMLIGLTIWVTLLMFLVSTKYSYMQLTPYTFGILAGFLCFIVSLFFTTDNLLSFYILFEASLIPTLLLILKWGYQPERTRAGTYFMMYTICASLPLLFVILKLNAETGHLSMMNFYPLPLLTFNSPSSYLLHLCLVLAFLVKIPMWGTHLWLPKAHVEAPVSGSMILAGILLKLGGYGLMKIFLLILYIQTSLTNLLISISLWGAVTISFTCLRQIDIKSLIAYSSIIHMALMIVGILSGTVIGWLGSAMMMLAHGLSSPGLFAMANYNYESSGSRNLTLQKGIALIHPISSAIWFTLLAANMAAPPSLNLGGEFLIIISILKVAYVLAILAGIVTLMAAGYNLYLYSIQQGHVNRLLVPSTPFSSQTFLTGFLHIIPVYLISLKLQLFSY